jgi:hypothetical protein
MTGREQGTRRIQRGRRAAAIGAMAVVAAVATAMAFGPVSRTLASPRATPAASPPTAGSTHAGQPATPLTDASVTPTAWSPVPYENAQLSVPGSWLVESPQQLSCGFPQADGMIFVGITPGFPKGYGCAPTASLAWILPAGQPPKGIKNRKPTTVINGIPVYRLPSAKGSTLYLVPELGVRVGARGRPASRVLATLTRSPLDVVLRRGPATKVPVGWAWRQFGGVRFATPRSWSLQRENQWATCGTGLVPSWLLLVDATKPPLALPCPFQFPSATNDEAQPGLTVVTGKYAAESVGENYGSCQIRNRVRICLSSVTGQGGLIAGVLIFSVSLPKHPATFFLLGLSGSGASARAIFDSVRAA